METATRGGETDLDAHDERDIDEDAPGASRRVMVEGPDWRYSGKIEIEHGRERERVGLLVLAFDCPGAPDAWSPECERGAQNSKSSLVGGVGGVDVHNGVGSNPGVAAADPDGRPHVK